jgi:tetratricopeptide (TPR) repeat protein
MMEEGYVPHVLTPNFDDLLFDAFYLYLEDKPQMIDHRAVAPEFRLTHSESSIVKLHGDYRYDNLRNTDPETGEDGLGDGMKDALQQTVEEYGLVVVGYSGGDDSIMDPLIEADLSEYGIYWCTRDADSFPDEGKAEELLQQPNTHLVEIEGFGSLMRKFGSRIDDVEPPQPDEITERAEERAEMLRGALQESKETVVDDEEEEYMDKMEKLWKGGKLRQEGDYEKAIDCYTEIIEQDSKFVGAYNNRGIAKHKLKKYEEAIADFDTAIELNHEYTPAYLNRAEIRLQMGDIQQARQEAKEAKELSVSTGGSAISSLLHLISKITLGKKIFEEESEYRNLCAKEFTTTWSFEELDSWLAEADLEPEKEDKIAELIDLLRDHKETPSKPTPTN